MPSCFERSSRARIGPRRRTAWPARRCYASRLGREADLESNKKGIAIVALGLGIVGLFTAGGLGVGSLLGLVLAGAALVGRSPAGGRDVAWAAVAANVLALATILPVGVAAWQISTFPVPLFDFQDDSLPVPAQPPETAFVVPPPPPPPPPREAMSAPERAAEPQQSPEAPARSRPAEASGAGTPLRIGRDIAEPPRKTKHVPPVYPPLARQARVQGVVILECTIDAEGRVADVKALRGQPLLTEAAIEAVREWEYAPTILDGVAVPVIMTVTVNFTLS